MMVFIIQQTSDRLDESRTALAASAQRGNVVKTVVVICAVALIALGGGAICAQEATADSAARQASEDADAASDMAMMAVPGVMTSESLAATVRYAKDSDAALKQINTQLLESPEVQERLRVRFRDGLPAQYPDIDEVLDLSPEQVNKLFDLLTKQYLDGRRAANAGGDAKVQADRAKADEAQISALLGKKYAKWPEYKAGLPGRVQVRDLGAALIAYDLALSDAQIAALIPAINAVQGQLGASGGPFTAESHRKLLDAASPHLSAGQLEVYQKLLERQASRARTAP